MLSPLMSGRRTPSAFALSVVAILGGCGTTPAAVDAAMSDAYNLPMSRLLGPCFEDFQCPGVGAICRAPDDGYPMGECTVPCVDRTECDDGSVYNECLMLVGASQTTCMPHCRNGADCRRGYTCEVTSGGAGGAESSGFCIPVCADDSECGGTSSCDPYTGRCVPHGMINGTGGVTGDPCTSATACRSGTCRLGTENGNYTGYVGGYCESLCRLPAGYNTSNFFAQDVLPQAGCAGNAVCFPGGSALGLNDLGICLASCSGPTGCRPGYHCVQAEQGHTFTNGVCLPIDCLTGGACPTGSTCHMGTNAQGTAVGICG